MKKRREDRIKEQMERELERQREQRQADEIYMKEAIKQAKKAYAIQEVPIGCVIVHEGKIIARGYNRRTTDKNPLAHAEISAIRKASKKLEDWRPGRMYLVCDPGTLSDVRRSDRAGSDLPVVVGCMNPKAGCAGSVFNLLQVPAFNHQAELVTGVRGEECSQMMKQFFKELRQRKNRDR